MHDINVMQFVIPGLTRNPVFSWIPAFAGITPFAVISGAVYIFYSKRLSFTHSVSTNREKRGEGRLDLVFGICDLGFGV